MPTVVSARSHPLFVVLLCLLSASAMADVVPWLYEVEVPVENQSREARLDASGEALLKVLTRVTGLVSVPRVEAVQDALSAPGRYYNQFRYVEVEGLDPEGRPLPGVRVTARDRDMQGELRFGDPPLGLWGETVSGFDGRFRISGLHPSRPYLLSVRCKRGDGTLSARVEDVLCGPDDLRVTVTAP